METCYRHPDRETGVSCSSCGRPICPDCMTTTSVGMRCPECARQRTPVRSGAAAYSDEPRLTYILIGINVAIALGALMSGQSPGGGTGGSTLIQEGAVSRFGIAEGEYWRLITSGFLHAGFFHLLFNMFALFILGSLTEPAIGRFRFGLIYFVSLLAGSFGALLVDGGPTVGASGAVFGLMGAAIVVMRNRGINPMESGLGLWLGLNLLITFTVPNISIGGHIGGLIGGGVSALLLFELGDRIRLPQSLPALLCVGLGALAVIGSIAVS